MKYMSEMLDVERMKNVKMRQTITYEIEKEVNKIRGHGTDTRHEF